MGMQGPRGSPGSGGLSGDPGKPGTPGRDGVPGEKGASVRSDTTLSEDVHFSKETRIKHRTVRAEKSLSMFVEESGKEILNPHLLLLSLRCVSPALLRLFVWLSLMFCFVYCDQDEGVW